MKVAYSSVEPSGDVARNLPPIILLHGMLDSRRTWKLAAPKIANLTGRKVYSFDARNHGQSPWSEDFDFEYMSRDLEEFMNDHRIQKAVLVGHSMGGKTVMKFAIDYPQRVEKLIVEDIIPKPFSENGWKVVVVAVLMLRESLLAIPKGADMPTAKNAVKQYLKEHMPLMTPKDYEDGSDFGLDIMPFMKKGDGYQWETNLDVLERVLTYNRSFDPPLLGTYMGPTLFLYGPKSYMRVGTDKLIPKFFPRAVRVPIEGATHMVHFEKPRQYLQELVGFINTEDRLQIPRSKY